MHHYELLVSRALEHLSHLSYPEMLLAILASGHPLPLPEGVVFFALGILAAHGVHTLLGIYLLCAAACYVYDIVLFLLAYGGSTLIAAFSKEAKTGWHDRYSKHTHSIFLLTLVSHFVPGWRMANPVIAAGLKVPPHKFALYSIVPALVYPPVYILAGYFLLRI